jgi:nucleoside-diphosphate-sugar epimerase
MKKVLVTGADGFIGSHLTEMLVAKGYQVKA